VHYSEHLKLTLKLDLVLNDSIAFIFLFRTRNCC